MVERTDSELVESAMAGDSRAIEEILRRHQPRLRAVCRRILNNDADADDATQNALIAIVRSLSSFDGRSAFSTWAYRIATNAALDEARRRQRRPSIGREELDTTRIVDLSSDRVFASLDERDALEKALSTVPEDFRVAVVLRDVADLDYEQIAQVLGIPIGTVRSRIARGRAHLADVLRNRDGVGDRQSLDTKDPS
jgi:RNA polymerase sigma-70 factor, ECF subfamily